ncbi:MAG: DUF5686 family protein [Syntrophothermus sp.]
MWKRGKISRAGISLLLIILPAFSFAQLTKIIGTITDAKTGEPLPFVNIIIPGTTVGTLTDFEGKYSLELKINADSLRATLMGYRKEVRRILPHQFQVIDIKMSTTDIVLPEVTIHYKGNPAEILLQKVIQHKEKNSLRSFSNYHYEAYTKVELDANNLSENLRNSRLLKPFKVVFDYIDTSTVNGKSFLPVFFTETLSDIYFRKNPRGKKEVIKATRSSGLEDIDFSQFLGNLAQEVDIYQNYIPLFEKNFVSPVADFGLTYYKYYLVDSLYMGRFHCYHVMFKPRYRQTLTFTGNLWITDTTFAILKTDMRIAGDANINFINDLVIQQEYDWMEEKYWMLVKDYMVADFNLIENARKVLGFYGHRTSVYRDFSFDKPEDKKIFGQPANVITREGSRDQDETFWKNARPEPLSRSESGVYKMTDSVKSVPVFRTYNDVLYSLFTGYIPAWKLEIGPWYTFYSFNGNEGNRFKIGGRTGNNFSKKVQLQGFLAYGTKDNTLKYGADIMYLYSKNPRRGFHGFYQYDVEQLGASLMAVNSDNIVSSIFHRGSNDKLTFVREYRLAYEHEWFTGFINTFTLTHREMFPLFPSFIIYPDGIDYPADSMSNIFTTEGRIDLRIAFRERYVSGQFYRYTISSPLPIIQLTYCYGFPNLLRSDFEYHRLGISIKQWFNFSTIGWSKYIIDAGKIWGELPYPLLKIHEGNQSFFFDEYASNLMNYYEFVSDEYITVFFTHHFEGLLLNRIPLFRKLKWREVGEVRAVYGTLTENNARFSKFPVGMRSFGKEIYWEAGGGIENIFRFFRIDAVWRMSHLNDPMNPHAPKFGIFLSANFSF